VYLAQYFGFPQVSSKKVGSQQHRLVSTCFAAATKARFHCMSVVLRCIVLFVCSDA